MNDGQLVRRSVAAALMVVAVGVSGLSAEPPLIRAAYFVATDGDDANPGTITLPWRTIQRAADAAFPGMTVNLRAGVYRPQDNDDFVAQITRSGTSIAPITFQAFQDEHAVIDASPVDPAAAVARRKWGLFINGAHYIVIRGLEIRSASRAGVRVLAGNAFTIEDCTIHDVRDPASVNVVVAGIAVLNAPVYDGLIRRNHVYDCSRGIYLRNDLGDPVVNCVIERNYVHDIHWWNALGQFDDRNADGIVLNHARSCTLRRNVIARCGDDGIDCYNSDECLIERNTVFNAGDGLSGSPPNANGDGNGIKVSTGGGGGHVILRNLAFNCERAGFDQDHVDTAAPGNEFYHNVSYGNGRNGFILERASSTPNLLRNNIAFWNDQQSGGFADIRVASPAVVEGDHNLWGDGDFPAGEGAYSFAGYPSFFNPPTPGAAVTDESLNMIVDPRSTLFGRVRGFDLHLFSPCIDAGQYVGEPYLSTAPDIGAYEVH